MKALWAFCLACGFAFSAQAGDCSKAPGSGKIVCGDPTWASLDQKLNAIYTADLARLPEPGRVPLRDGQQQWAAFVWTICGDTGGHVTEDCLIRQYIERIKQLDSAIIVAGGLKFRRTDFFKARKSLLPGETPAFDTLISAYPQIVTPMTPAQERFNKKLAAMAKDEEADFEEGGADITLDYDDIDVSEALISVNTSSSFFGHGAAHPNYSGAVIHWLRDEGRELTADDVFAKGTAWRAALRDFCFKEVKREGFIETPEDLNDLPEDPQRWLFTADALVIRFNPYEVAPYAEGMPQVTIAWSALKPYLAENAPVPPR